MVSSYRGWGGRGATPWPTGPVRLGRFCLSFPRSGAVAKSNRSWTCRCCCVFLSYFLRIVRGNKIPGSIRLSLLSLSNLLCPYQVLFGLYWVFLSAINVARSGRIRSSKRRLLQIILLRLVLGFLMGRAVVPTTYRFSSVYFCHLAKAVVTIVLPQGGTIGKGLVRIPGTLHDHAPGAKGIRFVYGTSSNVEGCSCFLLGRLGHYYPYDFNLILIFNFLQQVLWYCCSAYSLRAQPVGDYGIAFAGYGCCLGKYPFYLARVGFREFSGLLRIEYNLLVATRQVARCARLDRGRGVAAATAADDAVD